MSDSKLADVLIIGGSYAGLSAALALGRALRRVVVLDSGKPCNQQTPHSHNFLTRDGSTPAALAAVAHEQVLAYPTVQLRQELAIAATGENGQFTVETDSGAVIQARKLLFATGIRDLMPDLPGFAECWGISAIHCPYCHGYEYREQPTGILANGEVAAEMGPLIRNWTDKLTIFTNGPATLSPAQRQQLGARGIAIEETPLRQLVHQEGYLTHLDLADGRTVPLAALYARLPFEQHCALPQALGCTHSETGHLKVDNMQKTSVPGIYAAGDATSPMRAVGAAVAAGMMAGAALNRELIFEA
ncbi:NAD(P)/FAD-dependent oxidoreductase [Hymenobacter setariae]|uniref:NAD(P)/FAD-dependent oxidoreductase n=1 Tax=Hymenobacter setariae TaxID=2594794 RepID=A0A558BRW3_9BACT|nr:NAD(P)/FAD-dependent oxidoreductase [Hymenobacter setariae]TVT39257.1 NAD(P)/FAD-dependent oxidoreductase [Hymenobacter setariae]